MLEKGVGVEIRCFGDYGGGGGGGYFIELCYNRGLWEISCEIGGSCLMEFFERGGWGVLLVAFNFCYRFMREWISDFGEWIVVFEFLMVGRRGLVCLSGKL